MSFQHPTFLYALFALAIPIVIHLFNFRRYKKVYFTNVKFLEEVQEETRSYSRLKHLLLLLLRLLAISFLVFAFAQPYIPSENNKVVVGDKTISVYIDNSFSMDAENSTGKLLEIAKNLAYNIADSYSATDRFNLVTNDFEGKHEHLVNREQFIELVQEVELSHNTRQLSEIHARQKDILIDTESGNKKAFMIGDFQQSVTDLEELKTDTNITSYLLPLEAEKQSNLYIDSVWFETPVRQVAQQEKLMVRIRNNSDELLEDIPMNLTINNNKRGLNNFTIQPNSYIDSAIYYTSTVAGFKQAVVEITDIPITFDNTYYFSYEVADSIPVHCINKDNTTSPFTTLFSGNTFFDYTTATQQTIDYSAKNTNNLLILNELENIPSGLELKDFLEKGGSVAIFPAEEINMESYNKLLSSLQVNTIVGLDTTDTKVQSIESEHPFYQGVFENIPNNINLPTVLQQYLFTSNTKTSEEVLLRTVNGNAFLSTYPVGSGKLYLFSTGTSAAFGNLSRHALFVASLLRMAEFSYPTGLESLTIGEDNNITLHRSYPGETVFNITKENSDFTFTTEASSLLNKTLLPLHAQLKKAGLYTVTSNDKTILGVGFNYSRKESDLSCYSEEELNDIITKANVSGLYVTQPIAGEMYIDIEELDSGKKLWKWCIILVLVFLGLEIIVTRLMKTNKQKV